MEDNRQEIMIRASNHSHLTKDMLTDTWYMKGLMGVYNLGLEHMLRYLDGGSNSIAKCSNEEIWSWNETDDESWSHGTFDSREEAIEDALGNIEEIKSYLETDTPTIYLGKCEYVPLPTSVDSERILFDLDEEYCSETGCENYIYEGVTDEQTKWLEDKLSDLMIEFHKMIGLKPCWFRVVEQEEINLCEYEREKK